MILRTHGRAIERPQARTAGTPMGCALLAGFGVGVIKDIDRWAQKWVGRGEVTKPDRSESGCYARRLKRCRELLTHLNNWANS